MAHLTIIATMPDPDLREWQRNGNDLQDAITERLKEVYAFEGPYEITVTDVVIR